LSGSSAYGGSSGTAQTSAIKLGVLTPLTGPFAPWGIQVRSGMALAVNEINRSGGVKGRGQGRRLNLAIADDQSVNANAAIDGFRRLTEQDRVVAIGGLIGSNIAQATARLAEEARVPMFLVKAGANEILTQSSRYTFRTCLPAAAEVAVPIVQLAPNFTPYLRALGDVSLIVATGHPPGAGAILAQAGQLGMKAPVAGAYSPYSVTAKAAWSAAYGRWTDFKCMATATRAYKNLAKRYLRTFPQNGFFEDDALAGYAYVKIVAEAIQNVGVNPQAIATYVRTHTFNIPGYAFPLQWTAWGELRGPRVQFAVLTKGPPPESGLNTGGDWWPRVLFSSPPLTPYRP
jgi:ABC-type branched-subunit amino acid transport system substrate-binding protein